MSAMIQYNKVTRGKLIATLIAALVLGMLPQSAEAQIPVEEAQRQLQARFNFVTSGNYTLWPACRSGIPAPLYPPNGFYGNLDGDPWFAAYLVQDLCYQFYGYYWPLYWLDEEPFDDFYWQALYWEPWVKEGLTIENQYDLPVWYYGDEDFPVTGSGFDLANVTPANYAACFAVLRGYLSKLVSVGGMYGGIIGVDTNGVDVGFGACPWITNGCTEAWSEATGNFDWISDNSQHGYAVQVYTHGASTYVEPETWYAANVFAVRGQAYCAPTWIRGTVVIYCGATNNDGCPTVGANPPPFAVDGKYHFFWSAETSVEDAIYGTHLADAAPTGEWRLVKECISFGGGEATAFVATPTFHVLGAGFSQGRILGEFFDGPGFLASGS